MRAANKRLNPLEWTDDLEPVDRSQELDYPLIAPDPPQVRERLHTLCALYGHARTPEVRHEILGLVEVLIVETAQSMAIDLLAAGWRASPASQSPGDPRTGVLYLDI